MKVSRSTHRLNTTLSMTLFAAAVLLPPGATGQEAKPEKQIIPLIVMDNVPLTDAIRNLARQVGSNYILDPRLSGSFVGPDGRVGREPSVTVRWENLTAEQALDKVLVGHGLTLIANPATSVARIASTNQAVKPITPSQVGGGTNDVIPLVVMDSVPLVDAIRHLARAAPLEVAVDPALPAPASFPAGKTIQHCEVSFRWERITARQALAALLDNFDLVMVQDPNSASARIEAKKPAATAPPRKPGPQPRP